MKQAIQDPSAALQVPLYPRLLGETWFEVDEALRQGHLAGAAMRRVGSFRVRRGRSLLARLLLLVLRMPRATESTPIELIVNQLGCGEQWTRRFGGATFITTQTGRAGGILVERVTPIELTFQLEVASGSLVYRQIGAALRLGRLAIPLPAWMSPRVEAREVAEGLDRSRVSVVVNMPGVGLLIAYEGLIGQEAAR